MPTRPVVEGMQVEIFSDVVCPWCAIGKRRFEAALERFDHREEVDVHWRAFELDPSAPTSSDVDVATHLAEKYGMSRAQAIASQRQLAELAAADGLDYDLAETKGGNTLAAHRLIHLGNAAGSDVGGWPTRPRAWGRRDRCRRPGRIRGL